MKNYVESVEIDGFWGTKKVSLKLREDLNFIIGPNGSGKTTIINLISAVLRADIPALYSVQFKKVTITLKAIGGNRKPVIQVEKVIDQKMGSFELLYNIQEKKGEKGTSYGVEGPYDERIYRDYRHPRGHHYSEVGAHLSGIISDFVKVNWLSIHRANPASERRSNRDDGIRSPIDQKLRELGQAFSQYFSLLTTRAEAESKSFQEYVFLSLLDQERSGSEVWQQIPRKSEEKATVIGVLSDLKVPEKKATKSVNAHFARLENAKKRYEQKNTLDINGAITLSDAHRVSEMINNWRDLQKKRSDIFAPKIKFEEIINSLFSEKEIHFGERNIPMVHLNSGDIVDISVLSSGEKQLFILLGEALLQEEKPVVFISDEPELSLHVSWQSSLFANIRNLNSACQVISATHSPDIVGAFQDHVIHIENCITNVHTD